MPRTARVVIPDFVCHVTQRGNNRQDVFFVDEDRRAYLRVLGEQAQRYGLTVLAQVDAVLDMDWWRKDADPEDWRKTLTAKDEAEPARLLRTRTQTGRPLGSDRFVAKLEAKTGRRLRPLPLGRPAGQRKTTRATRRRNKG